MIVNNQERKRNTWYQRGTGAFNRINRIFMNSYVLSLTKSQFDNCGVGVRIII